MNEIRRKIRPVNRYYPSGALFSHYYPERTKIRVPDNVFPNGFVRAELVTRYESGAIKRIFPLYGQLSAFWTEEDEFNLLNEPIEIMIPGTGISRVFAQDIYLYESGNLHAVTLWKRTSMDVQTPGGGTIRTHFGVEFYEDGSLKSIEPAFGTRIHMDGREISVFDSDVWRLHAENNSLQFDRDGRIISFCEFTGSRKKVTEMERIFGMNLPEFCCSGCMAETG